MLKSTKRFATGLAKLIKESRSEESKRLRKELREKYPDPQSWN